MVKLGDETGSYSLGRGYPTMFTDCIRGVALIFLALAAIVFLVTYFPPARMAFDNLVDTVCASLEYNQGGGVIGNRD